MGAGPAEMPRNSGEREAREPSRYRLLLDVGDSVERVLAEVGPAMPAGPVVS